MTYAKLHFLTLVVFFYCDMSYISFIILFMILIIQLSFIYSLLCYYYLHTVYIHDHFPFFFTYLLGHFLTTLDLHVQIGCFLLLIRCLLRSYAREEPRVTLSSIIDIPVFFYSIDSLFSMYQS